MAQIKLSQREVFIQYNEFVKKVYCMQVEDNNVTLVYIIS